MTDVDPSQLYIKAEAALADGDVRTYRRVERELARLEHENDATKTCPDCAEEIKEAAAVCRYCGYRFATARPRRKSDRLVTVRDLEDVLVKTIIFFLVLGAVAFLVTQ